MAESITHGLSALFSSLRAQKQKLELLGSNIANINTPGYKTGRISFAETFGMVVANKQTLFSQGTTEFTGNQTDLAIVGNSFYVLRDGDNQYYTRAGAFIIDANGKFVTQNGQAVQGWMENVAGTPSIRGHTPFSDIIIDPNLIVPAQATENVWLSGNLNAGLENVAQVWTAASRFNERATITGDALQGPVDVAAGANDQFTIEINKGHTVGDELTLTAGQYADAGELVDEINAQIAASESLAGMVQAVADGGAVKFMLTDGGNDSELTLKAGTNDVLADMGFADGVSAASGTGATEETLLNDLIGANLVDGDTIEIHGVKADGTEVDALFTYGANDDGETVGDLLSRINAAYSGSAEAGLVDGKIVLTDFLEGESETALSLALGEGNAGEFSLPNFLSTVVGATARVTSSYVVYDSLGAAHNLTIQFVKTETNQWDWSISAPGDDEVVTGGTGSILFNSDGELVSFEYDDGATSVKIDPGTDASTMSIRLHGENGQGFTGMSQFDSVSTLFAREQDGVKTGTFNSIRILEDGSIIGSFTNGEQLRLAQLAMAKFDNPSALEMVGGNNLTDTVGSGESIIGTADSQGSRIQSGSLELSTVDLADQFIQMIEAQRAYQAGARVLSTFDQILQQTTQLGR